VGPVSYQAVKWVLDHSRAKGAARLVLIVLAEHANANGENTYPSVGTIARRAGLTGVYSKGKNKGKPWLGKNTVRKALATLERLGEIEFTGETSERETRVYRLIMEGGHCATPPGSEGDPRGGLVVITGGSEIDPEPSVQPPLQPSGEPKGGPRDKRAHRVDEYTHPHQDVWDRTYALVEQLRRGGGSGYHTMLTEAYLAVHPNNVAPTLESVKTFLDSYKATAA
jgi:hypothetical protein